MDGYRLTTSKEIKLAVLIAVQHDEVSRLLRSKISNSVSVLERWDFTWGKACVRMRAKIQSIVSTGVP